MPGDGTSRGISPSSIGDYSDVKTRVKKHMTPAERGADAARAKMMNDSREIQPRKTFKGTALGVVAAFQRLGMTHDEFHKKNWAVIVCDKNGCNARVQKCQPHAALNMLNSEKHVLLFDCDAKKAFGRKSDFEKIKVLEAHDDDAREIAEQWNSDEHGIDYAEVDLSVMVDEIESSEVHDSEEEFSEESASEALNEELAERSRSSTGNRNLKQGSSTEHTLNSGKAKLKQGQQQASISESKKRRRLEEELNAESEEEALKKKRTDQIKQGKRTQRTAEDHKAAQNRADGLPSTANNGIVVHGEEVP